MRDVALIVALVALVLISIGLVWAAIYRLNGCHLPCEDPFFDEGVRQARMTLGTFWEEFAQAPRASARRYRILVPSAVSRPAPRIWDLKPSSLLWLQGLTVHGDVVAGFVSDPPLDARVETGDRVEVSLSEVLDWRIEDADGRIRGFYSAQAVLRRYPRHRMAKRLLAAGLRPLDIDSRNQV